MASDWPSLNPALVAALLAVLVIRYRVDQIIAGTVINIGAVGITNFLFLRVLGSNTELNTPPTVASFRLPFLSEIPVLGPILFSARPYVYVGIILVVILTYMLFRTRWGLRLRAAGEKPAAAGTVGINVLRIRYQALLYAGLISGLAGSYLSLATAGSFQMQMTAGFSVERGPASEGRSVDLPWFVAVLDRIVPPALRALPIELREPVLDDGGGNMGIVAPGRHLSAGRECAVFG